MKYLGRPEASLVTMWVAARHLHLSAPATLREIHEALRPEHLTSGEGLALSGSLDVGADLGIFRREGEASPQFALGDALADPVEWHDRCDGLASIVRRQLISQASGPVDRRSDVSVGLGWLMSRDWRREHNAISDQDDSPRDAIETPEQAGAFVRWSRDLGLVRDTANGLRPDPTRALRQVVARATPGTFAAQEFLALLWPELPTGPGHPAAPSARHSEDDRESTEMFSSVGFALRRLEHDGVLALMIRDDAERRLVFPFPGPRDEYVSVTHIALGE